MEPAWSSLSSRLGIVIMVFSAISVLGQQDGTLSAAMPLVTDWSHHHLVYSNQRSDNLQSIFRSDARYWQQWLRRGGIQAKTQSEVRGRLPQSAEQNSNARVGQKAATKRRFRRDWAVSLGPGATAGAGQFPAKFSFNTTTSSCGSDPHPDFVVFNTSVLGSASQATIVAYDNLYSGCGGTVPSTYWAYNTGGTAGTSTTLSLDGSQLAFVQTSAGQAQLVLLKWQAATGVSSTNPGTITSVSTSQYPTCTAPCMTMLTFSGTANDTNSSPFYDYANDALYVGDDGGALHKFTPVFTTGAPVEVTSGWPVTLATGLKLSSPVFDQVTGRVFVGSAFSGSGSQLFAVSASSGVVVGTSSSLGQGTGIVSSPIVDSSTGKVFVFLGSDGTTGCSGPCSAVYQLPTNFTSGTGTKASVGLGGALPLYTGDFDNAYYTSADGTGSLYVCGGGFSTHEPNIFRVPISAGVMSTSSSFGPALGLSNVPCSPVTEVFNPESGGTDRLFASVNNGSDAAACSSGGCIVNLITTSWQPSTSYALNQRVLDPGNFLQVVATAGTSKTGSAPSWVDTCGNLTTDGTVTWVNSGFITPVTAQGWQANTFFSVGSRITDSNGNQECNLETGIHSATTPPVWNTSIGGLTTEVTGLQWRNGGPLASHALPANGGTSGIIMDNTVGSAILGGASQVYFSTLGTGSCGAGNGCAVQASQSSLN